MKKLVFGGVAVVFLLAIGVAVFWTDIYTSLFSPTGSDIPQGIQQSDGSDGLTEVIATDLDIPWAIIELPNGDLLVTERSGQLRRLGNDGFTTTIQGVAHEGEGGLLGAALHPDFSQNQQLYLYLTTRQGDGLVNRIERYRLDGNTLTDRQLILDSIPGASYHDGGRLAFGPDGFLYATTGDAGQPDSAQDTASLAGKILRITDDGSVPADNPFNTYVYSYGHRNPQGLAWDDQGRLWSTEHGPSGLQSGQDELNLIEKGANYGWPVIRGDESAEGMKRPVVQSGTDETWAPAGLAYSNGSLFFAGLRGSSLYQAKLLSDDTVKLQAHFRSDFGRLRAVVATDEALLISTSNRDGRGSVQEGDDKIISIDRSQLPE